MTGKIFVFEGLSASGKATQALMLTRFLESKGLKVKMMAFPTYHETEFGALVARYLKGEFGDKKDLPEIASLFYSLDRYQFRKRIQTAIEEGYYCVFDRYTTSNIGYQGAFFSGQEKTDFINWLKSVDSRMPPADAILFLDVPRSFTEKLIEHREQKNDLTARDIHETDRAYEEKVRETFLEEAKASKWLVIECVSDNELKSKDEVHANIVSALKNRNLLP